MRGGVCPGPLPASRRSHEAPAVTPISIGSGTGTGVYDVVIRDSVVDARWGNRTQAWLPKWSHTAIRFKTARGRGPAGVSGVLVSNVTVLGADTFVDFQPYYSCQNSSGSECVRPEPGYRRC